jgi:hypothetical protein
VAGGTKKIASRRGEQPRQRREHDTVGGLQLRPVYLAAEHRDLVAQHEESDVLGVVVAGELGQHFQHLAQEQEPQLHAHDRQRDRMQIIGLGQSLGQL